MIKIYLDWNIISKLKRKEGKELKNALMKNKNSFVFPFSAAHLRDLRRGDKAHEGYGLDKDKLSELCGTHLLEYSDTIDSAYPYCCTSEDYNDLKDIDLSLFSSGFTEDAFVTFFGNLGLDYYAIMDALSHVEIPPIEMPVLNITARNLKDMFLTITYFGKRLTTGNSLYTLINKYIDETTEDGQHNKIKFAKVETVFDVLDNITESQTGLKFIDIIEKFLQIKSDYNFFIALYLALDMVGFRSDKKRTMENRYADAEHAYYASKCDVFVTGDARLSEKAQAIYNKLGITTKIISDSDLIALLEDIPPKEYDLDYFFDEIAPKYSLPYKEEGDLQYYHPLPYQFYGLFNLCEEVELPKLGLYPLVFRCVLRKNGYVYFTELDRFFNYIERILPAEEIPVFRSQFRDVFLTRNKEKILKARYTYNFGSYFMELMADPDTKIPLPMMILV